MSEEKKSVENFENEIKLMDLIYTDMIEALHQRPDENDIEAIRLYIDNIRGVLTALFSELLR